MITNNKIPQGQLNSEVSQTITNGVTDKAPSENAVFDALTAKKDTFSIWLFGGALSPADNTTYYFNSTISPTTNAISHQMTFGFDCIITGAIVYFANNTVSGTSENNTVNFRNITTLTSHLLINNIASNSSTTNIVSKTVTGLSINVDANDNWCAEWITPNYVTNPTNTLIRVQLFLEKI